MLCHVLFAANSKAITVILVLFFDKLQNYKMEKVMSDNYFSVNNNNTN